MLKDVDPELELISETVNEIEKFIEKDQLHLDPFTVNEIIVLVGDLQEKAEEIKRALNDDEKPLLTIRRTLMGGRLASESSDSSDGVNLDQLICFLTYKHAED